MQLERQVQAWGNTSAVVVFPPDLLKYLNLNVGDKIIIQDDEGKYGKFISMWKKEE